MTVNQLASLAISLNNQIETNMDMNRIVEIALTVLSADELRIDQFRLPMQDSYKQETRNEQSMLYDCDFAANTRELYNFIYE